MIIAALLAKLRTEITIAGDLAKWDFGDGVERAAIFTAREKPPECGTPYMMLTQDDGEEYDTREASGDDVWISVDMFGPKSLSERGIRVLAKKVQNLLHRGVLTNSSLNQPPYSTDYGYVFVAMRALSPISIEDGNGFPGFSVDVWVRYYADPNLVRASFDD